MRARIGHLAFVAVTSILLSAGCGGSREGVSRADTARAVAAPDTMPAALVGTYFRVDSMPPGYRWSGGGIPIGGGFARAVRHFQRGSTVVLVHDSAFQDSARYGLHRILDAVQLPPLGDSLTASFCAGLGDVFAVVPNDGRIGRLAVRHAWRANALSGRWVPLAAASVECVREAEMQ